MSNKYNVRSGQLAAITSGYTTVPAFSALENMFGVYSPDTDVLVSLGYDVPADATSILVPAGGSWGVEFGITGAIAIKSTGTDQTVYLYGA